MSKNSAVIFAGIVLLTGIGAYAVFLNPFGEKTSNDIVACTMDAMQCPDGSYVGRTGPQCQFVCPQTVATSTPSSASGSVRFGTTTEILGLAITPLEILEDSRCPLDVQCIQAGTVRVRVEIETAATSTHRLILKLGEEVKDTATGSSITLVEVTPAPYAQIPRTNDDYRFSIQVKKTITH